MKMVVLNACYSEVHAEALLEHIDCVVGIEGSIGDDAAQSFAIGFYGGLGEGESVVAAYRHGCVAISLEGLPDIDRPRLKVREGIDAEQMVLASKPAEDYPHVACTAVDTNETAPHEGGIDPLQPTNHRNAARAFIGGVVRGRRLTVVATVAVGPLAISVAMSMKLAESRPADCTASPTPGLLEDISRRPNTTASSFRPENPDRFRSFVSRVAPGFEPRGSHGSGHADLPHPALRA